MDEKFGVNVDFQGDEDFGVPIEFQGDKDFGVDAETYIPSIGDKFDKTGYSLEKYSECANWCNENHATIIDQGEYYECVEIPAPPPPTIEEIKQGLINLVQQHLDAKCQSMGYDNGFACASYATSSVPKFKAEAEAFVLWRDRVWSYCYEQLDLFEAGQREIPTDIIAELPEWGEPND